ncbi:hypothetical protein N566_02005 [Streptomycetaceae bacterium MP113-05]|nr:hypothetical protein N566_02005 [Streptomycetaceae bacterium MP113-05]
MTTTQRRAASYVRQSKERADKSEGSPKAQKEATAGLIEREGWQHVGVYEDEGISAYSGVERPAFDRLIRDATAGHIDVIVVHYISRFSRQQPKDALPVILELQRAGVQLVSVNEGAITDDMVGLISLLMRLQAAWEESDNKAKHIKATKQNLRRAGGYIGGAPPYGFSTVTDTADGLTIRRLVHNPAEVQVIRDVFGTITKHLDTPYEFGKHHPGSLAGIAADLNRRGIPTRRGAWKVSTLRRIVSDPRIIGHDVDAVYTTRKRKDGSEYTRPVGYRSKRDEDGRPVMVYEPIVSAADFHQVQKWLEGRKGGSTLARGTSLLSGIGVLFCECGHTMNRCVGRTPTSTAYRCSRAKGAPQKAHTGGCGISCAKLEDYVARRIMARLINVDPADPEDREALEWLDAAQRRFADTVTDPESATELRSLRAELGDYEAERELLFADRKAGIYEGEYGRKRFAQEVAAIRERVEATEARIAKLEAAATPLLDPEIWVSSSDVDPVGPDSWWGNATIPERRDMLRLFVDRITVSKARRTGGRYDPDDVRERVNITWASSPSK